MASKLEEKLLIYSKSIHSDSGKHIRILVSWPQLAKDLKLKTGQLSLDEAFTYFNKLKQQIRKSSQAEFTWPWE